MSIEKFARSNCGDSWILLTNFAMAVLKGRRNWQLGIMASEMARKRVKNIRVKDTRSGSNGAYRYKHYCANCGKGPMFTDFPVYYSTNMLCSEECDEAFYPTWLRWILGLVIMSVWAWWFFGSRS